MMRRRDSNRLVLVWKRSVGSAGHGIEVDQWHEKVPISQSPSQWRQVTAVPGNCVRVCFLETWALTTTRQRVASDSFFVPVVLVACSLLKALADGRFDVREKRFNDDTMTWIEHTLCSANKVDSMGLWASSTRSHKKGTRQPYATPFRGNSRPTASLWFWMLWTPAALISLQPVRFPRSWPVRNGFGNSFGMLRKSSRRPSAVAFAFLLLLQALNADKLDELIDSVEAVVNKVAKEATVEFRRRFETVAECRCSDHACGSQFRSTDTCHQELGDAELCADCSGQKVPDKRVGSPFGTRPLPRWLPC